MDYTTTIKNKIEDDTSTHDILTTPTPDDVLVHTEKSTVFFSLSLTLFAIAGVVLFIRRCVRCPTAGTEMPPDGRANQRGLNLDATDDLTNPSSGHGNNDSPGRYNSINIIPYDYANIDDYKFVQTPTTPTPCSTPGLSPKRFGRFNPHLAHLAGFNFRRERCSSCQKNLRKQSRESVHKDFRYFCRNCRMLHRYDESVDRSCTSLAYDPIGSTGSCLDKKAFYCTPTHIHLAIISSGTHRKKKELRTFKAAVPFQTGALHDTKSESNIAKSHYSFSRDKNSDDQDIFSQNPRRKISDICTHSVDVPNESFLPRDDGIASLSTIYASGAHHKTSVSGRDSRQSCSYEQEYDNSQYDFQSQTSLDYISSSCLQLHRQSISCNENNLLPLTIESKPSFYLDDKDVVLSPTALQSQTSLCVPNECVSLHSHQRSTRMSQSPYSPSTFDCVHCSGLCTSTQHTSMTRNSVFSFEVSGEEGSTRSNSIASSLSSLQYSPCHSLPRPPASTSRFHHQQQPPQQQHQHQYPSHHHLQHQYRTGARDKNLVPRSVLRGYIQRQHDLPTSMQNTSTPSSLWYSMTSVNTSTDEERYDEEDEQIENSTDDDDGEGREDEEEEEEDEVVTIAERLKHPAKISQVDCSALNRTADTTASPSINSGKSEIDLTSSKT